MRDVLGRVTWGSPQIYAQLYADSFTEEYRKALLLFLPADLRAKVQKELSRMKVKPALENRPGCQPLGYRDDIG